MFLYYTQIICVIIHQHHFIMILALNAVYRIFPASKSTYVSTQYVGDFKTFSSRRFSTFYKNVTFDFNIAQEFVTKVWTAGLVFFLKGEIIQCLLPR